LNIGPLNIDNSLPTLKTFYLDTSLKESNIQQTQTNSFLDSLYLNDFDYGMLGEVYFFIYFIPFIPLFFFFFKYVLISVPLGIIFLTSVAIRR
tara:strand:- start:6828 stop:7106 length:279 start_codon:yes stop_codon:yes gene_type:complete